MEKFDLKFSDILSRISPAEALKFLLEILHSPLINQPVLLESLSHIDLEIYLRRYNGESLEDINKSLIEKFVSSDQSIKNFFLSEQAGNVFSLPTLKFIYTLIFMPYTLDLAFNQTRPVLKDNIYLLVPEESKIIAIFYLATKYLTFFAKFIKSGEEVPGTFEHFYLKVNDPAATIGRVAHLYLDDNHFFNNELVNILGIDGVEVEKLLQSLFAWLFAKKTPVMHLEAFKSLNELDRIKLAKILTQLVCEPPSNRIILSPKCFIEYLNNELRDNALYRGRPFIKIKESYICFHFALLLDVIADSPYYLIFNHYQKIKKNIQKLTSPFGYAYEAYINKIAGRVIVDMPYKKNPKFDKDKNEYADLEIEIDIKTILLWETKSTRPIRDVKLALVDKIIAKYVVDFFQLINNVNKYRRIYKFDGEMFAVIAFYDAPGSLDVEHLIVASIQKFKKSSPEYASIFNEYKTNLNNHKVIWLLNSNTTEMFFSALKQRPCLKELVVELSAIQPLEVANALKKFIEKHNLRYSIAPLFEGEINDFGAQQADLWGLRNAVNHEIIEY